MYIILELTFIEPQGAHVGRASINQPRAVSYDAVSVYRLGPVKRLNGLVDDDPRLHNNFDNAFKSRNTVGTLAQYAVTVRTPGPAASNPASFHSSPPSSTSST